MVRFITVFASALSLLSFTHAATIDARGCGYACPATLRDGTGKLHESEFTPGHIIECLYDVGLADGALYSCSYSEVGYISLSNFHL